MEINRRRANFLRSKKSFIEPSTVLADLNKCKKENTNKLMTVEYAAPTLPNNLIKK